MAPVAFTQNEDMEIENAIINDQKADNERPKKSKAKFEIKRGSSLATPKCEVNVSIRKMNKEIKKAVEETPVPLYHPLSNVASECSDQYNISLKAMSKLNSTPDDDWVRLNVGGKVFETTKFTLSRHPESFLARLVNGELSQKKDDSGAFFVDGDPEHFRTILTYLRRGVLNLDENEKNTKDLLCEAVHYNIEPMVNEIRKAMRHAINRTEMVLVSSNSGARSIGQKYVNYIGHFSMSEKSDDYEVLEALRQKVTIKTDNSYEHFIVDHNEARLNVDAWMQLELILRNFGFVKEEISDKEYIKPNYNWKFIRTIFQTKPEKDEVPKKDADEKKDAEEKKEDAAMMR